MSELSPLYVSFSIFSFQNLQTISLTLIAHSISSSYFIYSSIYLFNLFPYQSLNLIPLYFMIFILLPSFFLKPPTYLSNYLILRSNNRKLNHIWKHHILYFYILLIRIFLSTAISSSFLFHVSFVTFFLFY